MSPEWMVAIAVTGFTICYLSALLERRCIRREQARLAVPGPEPARPWTAPEPGPSRPAPEPVLTPAELAYLAELAARYGDDPKAGWAIADFLRRKVPDMPDVVALRYSVAYLHVARVFRRNGPTGADAFDRYIHQIGGAVLDLSRMERQEAPSND